MLKRWASFAAAGLTIGSIAAIGSTTAEANPCRSLEMRLMQAQAGGRDTSDVRSMLAARGCGGGSPANAAPRQAAAAAPRQSREMNGLRILGRVGAVRREERRPERREARRQEPRHEPRQERRAERQTAERQPSAPRSDRAESVARGSGRTFRTLCVRTCDGYYFPVSYSTTREHFATDLAACQQMCPGTETSLFYHAVRGEAAEDMVSVDGVAYVDLPTAFQYRTTLDSSCSCGASNAVELASAQSPAGEPADSAAALPRPRPAPGVDPETLANRFGGLDPQDTSTVLYASQDGYDGDSVRIVEPSYSAIPSQSVIISAVPVGVDPTPGW